MDHSYQMEHKIYLLLSNTRVLQHVLADICVHLEDTVGGLGLCGGVRMRIIALPLLDLGHLE